VGPLDGTDFHFSSARPKIYEQKLDSVHIGDDNIVMKKFGIEILFIDLVLCIK